MQIGQFGSKIFFSKNMPKMNLQEQLSCFVQKTTGKNSQNLRNETILKIDHFGKSIAHAKWAVGSKIVFSKNMPKMNLQQQLSSSVQKPLEKTAKILEMRLF